ncbi:hypothetical protein ACH5RR_000164 [Cinchona calisaya]|uniref:Uncharacterized protein n=1 Tax=Cinchona calisaya TaxID=153742 RepID=A0ABD3AZZ9_9GENT
MRIRKHAKISPLLYASSSSSATAFQTHHVCQLNQSPWDVMTFSPPHPSALPPPPPFLVDKDYTYWRNGSFEDHIPADKRQEKWGEEDKMVLLRLKKEETDSIFCCNIDEKGKQCKMLAKNGQSQVKKSESRRRPRPKKPASSSSSSSNPYEFYYYSGFGPPWGKRRGVRASTAAAIKEAKEDEDEELRFSTSPQSSSDKNIVEINSQIDKDGLDYVEEDEEDDDEDDKNENNGLGRKRCRKPIKARSLKSLM